MALTTAELQQQWAALWPNVQDLLPKRPEGCWVKEYCDDCDSCKYCDDCDYCKSCDYCTACRNCKSCDNCDSCKSCDSCDNCYYCDNLTGKKYCILNIQFTKEEYFKKIKELKAGNEK